MKTWIRITAAIIVSSLVALPALAATVSLVPSTDFVSEGGQFTVDLVMDASDVAGNHPGIFRGKVLVDFDGLLIDYVGFEYNSPATEVDAAIVTADSVQLGFNNSNDVAIIGTFTFDVLAPAGSTISLGLDDAIPLLGTFFNTDPADPVVKFEPYFNGAEVSVVPIPAAVWLFASGLAMLGFTRRKKLFAS